MPEEIIKNYPNKQLGNAVYGNNVGYYVEDFLNINRLSHIIAETYSSESRINQDGIRFIKDYYGLHDLAKILEANGGVEGDLKTADAIFEWLIILEKEAE
jgi:hypothetical protein